jgi:hypothetical protein
MVCLLDGFRRHTTPLLGEVFPGRVDEVVE